MYAQAWKFSLKMLAAVLLVFALTVASPPKFVERDVSYAVIVGLIAVIAIYMRLQAKRFPCPSCGTTIFSKWGISSFFPSSKCSNCGHRFAS